MTDQTALVLPAPAARRPVLLLIALALAGWGVLAAMVLSMPGGGAFQDFLSLCTTTTPALGWPSPAEAGSVLLMWMAMALAMMMPTAVPAAMACASAKGEGGAFSFIAGYLVVYGFFAVASSVLQLSYGALVATMPDLEGAGLALSGSVLLLGGLYQFTPAKLACLARCRRPAERFQRVLAVSPQKGGFAFGLHEGVFCIGACWLLMAVMTVLGMTNLVWTAALAIIILAEKMTEGRLVPWFAGMLLVVWGGALIAASPAGQALLARFLG